MECLGLQGVKMVNLRLMEDRLERYDRKIVELNDELIDSDYGDRTVSDIKADIKYYEKLLIKLEEKYINAGGKNLVNFPDDSLLLDD